MPFERGNNLGKKFKKGHIRSLESIEKQKTKMKGRINDLAIEKMNTPESNARKSHKGFKHPLWIKDRSKLKKIRMQAEEKWFFKEVISERKYICEITGNNGTLSVHHIKPVWKYPELRFVKENVIVVLKKIHKYFHRLYGLKSDENDWYNFLNKKEYVSIP